MLLSEAIEAVGKIVRSYNGGKNADAGYIGALAHMLASFPRSVAMRCVDPVKGIVRTCKFLPQPADVVAWCERDGEPLHRDRDRELRVQHQLKERAESEAPRTDRLTYDELKAKYGDGEGGWGIDKAHASSGHEWLTGADLAAIVGQEAFDKIPNRTR